MSKLRLPSAVVRAGQLADEALKSLMADQAAEDGQFAGEGDPSTDTGIATGQAASPQAEGDEPPIPAQDEGAGPAAGSDTGIDWKAEADALKEERNRLTATLNTLNGKYRAEVPRLVQQVKDLQAQLASQSTAPAKGTPAAPLEVDGKGEAELREMYGDELVNRLIATEQRAAEAVKREIQPVLDRLAQTEQRAEVDAEEAMFVEIATSHKDWEQINELATWHKFLAEVNPDTGEPRQVAINRAQQRRDAAPIIRQLAAFKRRTQRGNQALETQVVPGDSGRTEAPAQPDSKVYSTAEVDTFFRKMAHLKARNTPTNDDTKRLEALFTRALLEGRVR